VDLIFLKPSRDRSPSPLTSPGEMSPASGAPPAQLLQQERHLHELKERLARAEQQQTDRQQREGERRRLLAAEVASHLSHELITQQPSGGYTSPVALLGIGAAAAAARHGTHTTGTYTPTIATAGTPQYPAAAAPGSTHRRRLLAEEAEEPPATVAETAEQVEAVAAAPARERRPSRASSRLTTTSSPQRPRGGALPAVEEVEGTTTADSLPEAAASAAAAATRKRRHVPDAPSDSEGSQQLRCRSSRYGAAFLKRESRSSSHGRRLSETDVDGVMLRETSKKSTPLCSFFRPSCAQETRLTNESEVSSPSNRRFSAMCGWWCWASFGPKNRLLRRRPRPSGIRQAPYDPGKRYTLPRQRTLVGCTLT